MLVGQLVHLQRYHLLRLAHLQLHLALAVLGGLERIDGARVQYRNIHHHTRHQRPAQRILEPVEHIRARHQVATRGGDVRQQPRSRHPHPLLRHAVADAQHPHLRTPLVDTVQIMTRNTRNTRITRSTPPRPNLEHRVQRHPAPLRQQHLGQRQPVGGLGEVHLRLVQLDAHLRQVALRRHLGLHHLLHIAVQRIQQGGILLGQLLLVLHADHLPVSLVDGNERLLALLVHLHTAQLRHQRSRAVQRPQLAAHIDRLRHRHRAGHHIPRVCLERAHHFVAHPVQRTGQRHAAQHTRHPVAHGRAAHRQLVQLAVHIPVDVFLRRGAHITQALLLALAEELYLTVHPQIGAVRTQLRQHLPQRHLLHRLRLGHPLLRTLQPVVLPQRALAALLQRQLAAGHRQLTTQEQQYQYLVFHSSVF